MSVSVIDDASIHKVWVCVVSTTSKMSPTSALCNYIAIYFLAYMKLSTNSKEALLYEKAMYVLYMLYVWTCSSFFAYTTWCVVHIEIFAIKSLSAIRQLCMIHRKYLYTIQQRKVHTYVYQETFRKILYIHLGFIFL